jgi:hypothetical protein
VAGLKKGSVEFPQLNAPILPETSNNVTLYANANNDLILQTISGGHRLLTYADYPALSGGGNGGTGDVTTTLLSQISGQLFDLTQINASNILILESQIVTLSGSIGDVNTTLLSEISGQLFELTQINASNISILESQIVTLSGDVQNLSNNLSNFELGDLNDVSINSVLNNQVLAYNQSISGWTNLNIAQIAISGAENFVSKDGDTIQYININEHLKVGNLQQTAADGMMWYDTEFKFRENGETKNFGNIIDNHIMKALEKDLRINSSNSLISYLGEAEPGSNTGNAVWRVRRITETSTGEVRVDWADGNGNFDNIFDNRESLSYS